MNLDQLKNVISYKWRVQSFSKFKAQGQCVAYIDARQVQDLLDEVVGAGNWQDEYYSQGGLLFCKIGIKIGSEWVWKSDTGSESNMEAEKGHSSDAFKRSAVKWGIGRFLYNLKIQYVEANEIKKQGNYPYPVHNGERIWDLTSHINKLGNTVQPENKTDERIKSAFVNQNEKFKMELKKANIDVDLFYKTFSIDEKNLTTILNYKEMLVEKFAILQDAGIKNVRNFLDETEIKLTDRKMDLETLKTNAEIFMQMGK